MDTAEFLENVDARPQQKVIGVGEQDLGAAFQKVFASLGSDGGMRPNRHESGCQYLVMSSRKARGARSRTRGRSFQFEVESSHQGALNAKTVSYPIRRALVMLKGAAEGFGFMHESYYKDDSRRFTRAWFAWANTLFGELTMRLAAERPHVFGGDSSYWRG